jgi:hypothetical protein
MFDKVIQRGSSMVSTKDILNAKTDLELERLTLARAADLYSINKARIDNEVDEYKKEQMKNRLAFGCDRLN